MNRPARATDYPALRRIQRAALDEPAPSLLEAATSGAVPSVVREQQTETGSELIGYLIFIPDTDTGTVHIPELAVHPEYQRAGHGTALVEEACNSVTESERLSLTVAKTDTDARRFYEAVGFEVVETLPEYFASGDGLLLHRELTG